MASLCSPEQCIAPVIWLRDSMPNTSLYTFLQYSTEQLTHPNLQSIVGVEWADLTFDLQKTTSFSPFSARIFILFSLSIHIT